jgi:hypothetical protein
MPSWSKVGINLIYFIHAYMQAFILTYGNMHKQLKSWPLISSVRISKVGEGHVLVTVVEIIQVILDVCESFFWFFLG